MITTTKNSNPIILIDDDSDDIELFQIAFKEIGVENEILVFEKADKFYDYITTTMNKAFFVFCDINMSGMSGFELKQKIFDNEEIRLKCIPFLMLSTSGASKHVMEAYSLNVQGYFIKPNSVQGLKDMFDIVVKYWSMSQRPASER
ncbi:MAG TPA: response regulator [Flavisolibacter sp.]|jgi:DNA-binding NtrC family response regulator|nr:response regulator [Flavisolibacter sp.]